MTLAMVDPADLFAIDDIRYLTGLNIKPAVASESAIMEAIKKHYQRQSDGAFLFGGKGERLDRPTPPWELCTKCGHPASMGDLHWAPLGNFVCSRCCGCSPCRRQREQKEGAQ